MTYYRDFMIYNRDARRWLSKMPILNILYNHAQFIVLDFTPPYVNSCISQINIKNNN